MPSKDNSVSYHSWNITDKNNLQCQRIRKDPGTGRPLYDMVQINEVPGLFYKDKFFNVHQATVDLSHYCKAEIEEFLDGYGYASREDLMNRKSLTSEQADARIAKMAFEMENHQFLYSERLPWPDAVSKVAGITGLNLRQFLKEIPKEPKQPSLDARLNAAAARTKPTHTSQKSQMEK